MEVRRLTTLYWAALIALVLLAVLACGRRESAKILQQPKKPLSEETTIHPQSSPAPRTFHAPVTEEEVTAAAQAVWGEARGVESRMEQAAVVWCMLNRMDARGEGLGEVVTAPYQFAWSLENDTVDDYGRDLEELVWDVIHRWEREKNGESDVGRVLPAGYQYFGAQGGRNWFRSDYDSFEDVWDWSLPDPYEAQ